MSTSGWAEVADGVFRARYEPLDVSVCVVRGSSGLLLVDTRSSHREADEIRSDLAVFGPVPVRWVVNTHAHFDHCFGNARFGPASDIGAPIYGHERVPAHLDAYEHPWLARAIAEDRDRADEWREVQITAPSELVGSAAQIDVGDRVVELLHLGRGHTDNDLILHVPDADAWLVGDLVEESGPPMYGSGSFPLEWPDTLTALHGRLGERCVVVPGHGAVVDPAFVAAQEADLRTVAAVLRELYAAGVPAGDAVGSGAGRWPFPAEAVALGVEDAYRQLTASTPG